MSVLRLPHAEDPAVSICMVTYGAGDWALRAIEAVASCTPEPYELVVVDNASPDGTGNLLEQQIQGATVVRNRRNLGFGAASNQAALAARAPVLCLLNSDALVSPGWLGPMLSDLEELPWADAVAPMMRNLDGTLQEAGCMVAADGRPLTYGYGEDAGRPEHGFRRVVDYGSGACLAVRSGAFHRVGGFDPAFGLGYCEDIDLCLSLAAAGGATLYEPRSEVVHARGASGSASDAAAEMDALREANTSLLARRWRDVLGCRGDLDSMLRRQLAARDLLTVERILVLTPELRTLGPGDAPAVLSARLAEGRPDARVTLAATAGDHPGAGLAPLAWAGVELACTDGGFPRWLGARAGHYTAIALCSAGKTACGPTASGPAEAAASEDGVLAALRRHLPGVPVTLDASAPCDLALAPAGCEPPRRTAPHTMGSRPLDTAEPGPPAVPGEESAVGGAR
ncbi:MAG: glycosyltransferase [Acidimicrobiales bacterium]